MRGFFLCYEFRFAHESVCYNYWANVPGDSGVLMEQEKCIDESQKTAA